MKDRDIVASYACGFCLCSWGSVPRIQLSNQWSFHHKEIQIEILQRTSELQRYIQPLVRMLAAQRALLNDKAAAVACRELRAGESQLPTAAEKENCSRRQELHQADRKESRRGLQVAECKVKDLQQGQKNPHNRIIPLRFWQHFLRQT